MRYEIITTRQFDDWHNSLPHTVHRAVATRLVRLQSGLLGDVNPVGGGVSEFRLHMGPGYRVYFVIRGRQIIFVLNGGDKGSQKRDIAKAKALAAEIE